MSPMRARFMILALAPALTLACKTSAPRSNLKLVGGQAELRAKFDAVFWMNGCTAAKVGPTAIMTAAHCVYDRDARDLYPDYRPEGHVPYSTSKVLPEKKPFFKVRETIVFEKYKACPPRDTKSCTTRPDVALIRFFPHGALAQLPVAKIDYDPVLADETITLTGYGTEDESGSRSSRLKSAQSRVASEAELEHAVCDSPSYAPIDHGVFFGSLGVLRVSDGANLGSGDSGGPVWRGYGEGPQRIIGVNSFGLCEADKPFCQFLTNSFYTRIDKGQNHEVGEWIERTLGLWDASPPPSLP